MVTAMINIHMKLQFCIVKMHLSQHLLGNDKPHQLSITVKLKGTITQLSNLMCTLKFETNERYCYCEFKGQAQLYISHF